MSQRGVSLVAVVIVGVCGGIASASVPSFHGTNAPSFDAVVRVNNQGTGTVINKRPIYQTPKDPSTPVVGYDLCVLTADHVVNTGAAAAVDTISFGNLGDIGLPTQLFPSFVRNRAGLKDMPLRPGGPLLPPPDPGEDTKPHNPDMAVLGVRVMLNDLNRNFMNNLRAIPVRQQAYGLMPDGSDDPNDLPRTFSSAGYGVSGAFVDVTGDGQFDGYDKSLGYGTKRVYNNTLTADTAVNLFQSRPDEPGQGSLIPPSRWDEADGTDDVEKYTYERWVWTLDKAGLGDWVAGEGASWSGDSGAPYLISRTEMVILNGIPTPVQTGEIIGVHTAGSYYEDGNGAEYKLWQAGGGFPQSSGWGVRLTPDYIAWINDACMQVPTPSSAMALWLAGICGVVRRRR